MARGASSRLRTPSELVLLTLTFHHPFGVLLALVPALFNAGLVVYALRRAPRDRITTVFVFFTAMLMTWQLYHVFIRASVDAEAANAWRGLLGFGFLLAMPAGVHLALLFAGLDRIARSPAGLVALYLPAALLEGGYRAGLNGDIMVPHAMLGWVAGGDHSVMGKVLAVWSLLLTAALAGILWTSVARYWHDVQRRNQALLLAAGITVPICTGVLFEIVYPQVLSLTPFPITSTTLTAYSFAALLAMTQFELFTFSPDSVSQVVLDNVSDMVVVTDTDGRLLLANAAACRIFGLVPGELHDYSVHALFPVDRTDQDFERGVWKPTIAGRNIEGYATRVVPRSGAPIPVLVSTTRISIEGSGAEVILLVAHDVSALKRTEEALWSAKQAAEQANAAKSRFLANMTQALLPPLDTVVEKSTQLASWAERNQYVHLLPELQEVKDSGLQVKQLVDDILDLTRIESGRLQLFSDEIDVRSLVDKVSVTTLRLCGQRYDELLLDVHPEVGKLRADRAKLETVLVNVLSFATGSCEEGEVRFAVAPAAIGVVPGIQFTVSDTGPGLDSDQQALLFKAFAEVAPSKHGRRMTGIELTLARQYCRLMGGEVTVESTVGEGTTFRVWLPLDAVPESRPVPPLGATD